MSRINVRLPEPKEEYEVTTQRQINRSVTGLVEQLNTTYQQVLKDEQEQEAFFFS
jgi:hypothetical protein